MLKHIQVYLEEELGFKLCIHERDFMPGTSIIGNIEEAVKHSRRTIVVISKQVSSFLVLGVRKIQHNFHIMG